ncbi:hypothetical protein GGF32_002224 [Allomyces javanicus]|nr:hypothetical protein GGF32_002224 [Allomyces javanicus]
MTSTRAASAKRSSILALLALAALLLVSTPANSATAIASRDVQLFKRRFEQENPTVLNDVRALGRLPGSPPDGRFDQIAGAFISTLLAATDPCARYPLADKVVERGKKFGFADQAIKVARQLVAVEKNFNPFAGEKAHPAYCDNPALPASAELRCFLPQVDPVSDGNGGLSAAEFNAKAGVTVTGQNANKNGGKKGNGKKNNKDGQRNPTATVTMTVTVTAGSGAAAPTKAPAASTGGGSNVQTFKGALFGKPARPDNFVGGARPFQVIVGDKLNGDFLCDQQNSECHAAIAQGQTAAAKLQQGGK